MKINKNLLLLYSYHLFLYLPAYAQFTEQSETPQNSPCYKYLQNHINNNDRQTLSKANSLANITVQGFSMPDSSGVKGFKGILYHDGIEKGTLISDSTGKVVFANNPTPVVEQENNVPDNFALYQNFPNPFNPSTTLKFSVPQSEHVSLKVYNAIGQEVSSLEQEVSAGTHQVKWNPSGLATGMYIAQIKAGDYTKAIKMLLLDGSHNGGNPHFEGINAASAEPNNSNYNANRMAKTSNAQEAGYAVRILNMGTTMPEIVDTLVQIGGLASDTTINVYLAKLVKNAGISGLNNVSLKEDTMPPDSLIIDLTGKGIGYDNNGKLAPDSSLQYLLLSQADTSAFKLKQDGRKIKLAELKQDATGNSDAIIRVVAPNGQYADANLNVAVTPMTDIKGSIDSLFVDDGQKIPGVNVNYGAINVVTDGNGNYALQVDPNSAAQRLILSKDGFHVRTTSEIPTGKDTTVQESLADTSMHMDFFDATSRFRLEQNGYTSRWFKVPVYYIDTSAAKNSNGTTTPVTKAMLDTMVSVIQNDVKRFTHEYISNPVIIVGNTPPAYGTSDTIRVEWDNRSPGLGGHGEYLDADGDIQSAYAKVKTSAPRGTYVQEVLQTLGPRDDSNLQKPSSFNNAGAGNFMVPLDDKVGAMLYKSNTKTSTPDNSP